MKRIAAMLLLATLLAGCSSGLSDSRIKPTFGGASASVASADELAKAKAAARVEDCPSTTSTKATVKGLPALTLDCLGGGAPVWLAGLRGEPTVINLWASWCGPCREELPLLAKSHRELGDRVRIVGIDFADDAADVALDLAAKSGVTYPLLADPTSSLKSSLKVVGLPQTIFVDEQGTIVATERRAYRSYDQLTAAISRHLGVTP
ncbi:MAG: TlpA family protein disulfide reductase [Kineosporiaceae bacterium]|nr:TlpA family protein disulfide reductase [Aeromicrobium sp.]